LPIYLYADMRNIKICMFVYCADNYCYWTAYPLVFPVS